MSRGVITYVFIVKGIEDLTRPFDVYASNETVKANSKLQKGCEELGKLSAKIGNVIDAIGPDLSDEEMKHQLAIAYIAGQRMEEVADESFDVKSAAEATADRSMSMLLAAMKRHKTKVLWKIGDAHVSDMKEALKGAEPEFALQHRSEFNETYGELFRRMAL